MIERLASVTRRWRWPIAIVWIVAVACAGVVATGLPGRLSGGGWEVAGSQSAAVEQALQTGFVGRAASTLTVVVRDT